ncbi:MAG TPA: hypothetical protein VGK19_20200 [Capsulimonadaceae bacterium]
MDPITHQVLCNVTVTVTKTAPGDYTSSVGCTVTWTVHDKSSKPRAATRREAAQGCNGTLPPSAQDAPAASSPTSPHIPHAGVPPPLAEHHTTYV